MKIVNLISKIVAIVSIFGGSSAVLINRYSSTQTIEVNNSIGLLPTILIATIILVAMWFTTSQLAEMIRQSKFGWLSIIFFGLTLAILLFGVWFMFNSIIMSVQTSVEEYIAVMEYHRQTVFYMMFPIVFGISLSGISKLIQWKIIK
jgi:hypothetical protein